MDTILLLAAIALGVAIVALIPTVTRRLWDERALAAQRRRRAIITEAGTTLAYQARPDIRAPRPTHRDDDTDQGSAAFMATVTGDIYPDDHPVSLHAAARRQRDEARAEIRALNARVVELERELAIAQRDLQFRPPADPIVAALAKEGPLTLDALRFQVRASGRDLNGRLAHLMLRTGQVERIDHLDGSVLFAYVHPAADLVAA